MLEYTQIIVGALESWGEVLVAAAVGVHALRRPRAFGKAPARREKADSVIPPHWFQGTNLSRGADAAAVHIYSFDAKGWGDAMVVDTDGQGRVELGGVRLGECKRWRGSERIWIDASTSYYIYKVSRPNGRKDLVICHCEGVAGGTITIQDWSEQRSLGIRLEAVPPPLQHVPAQVGSLPEPSVSCA